MMGVLPEDIETLIKAADHCNNWGDAATRCEKCPGKLSTGTCAARCADEIIAVRDHYEAKLKDRDSEVARFVRLFMEEAATGGTHMDVKHLELLAEAIEKLNEPAGDGR